MIVVKRHGQTWGTFRKVSTARKEIAYYQKNHSFDKSGFTITKKYKLR